MFIQKILFTSLMTVGGALAFSPASVAAAPGQSPGSVAMTQQQVQMLTQQIKNSARARGFQVKSVKIHRSLSTESLGMGVSPMAEGGSCTVSATVSIPGGTGVTISATAPTCAQAEQMVMAGIQALYATIGEGN
jgi:hypothetical protein